MSSLRKLQVEQPEPDGVRHPEQHRVRDGPRGYVDRHLRQRGPLVDANNLHFVSRQISGKISYVVFLVKQTTFKLNHEKLI